MLERLRAFMSEFVYPNERVYDEQLAAAATRWSVPPVMEELKSRARDAGLWNLFMPEKEYGAGLTNREYAPLCETMGASRIAPEIFNCNAPDTGNMEVLARYGTPEQKERWLAPLLRGEIRSGFCMTEPGVASSDATNIAGSIVRDGDEYVLNGRKWWTTGAAHPLCKLLIFMGKSNPEAAAHLQQSMILVPARYARACASCATLTVFGYDDAPYGHCEVAFDNVRVPLANVILGEGRGFEIAQGRLGPGRLHHCLRLIGLSERALAAMCARVKSRTAFGKKLADQGVDPRMDRALAHRDRSAAPAGLRCGRAARSRRRQSRRDAHRDGKGRRAERRTERRRSCDSGVRRRRHDRRKRSHARVDCRALAAHRRRPRRSAPASHRQGRTRKGCRGCVSSRSRTAPSNC